MLMDHTFKTSLIKVNLRFHHQKKELVRFSNSSFLWNYKCCSSTHAYIAFTSYSDCKLYSSILTRIQWTLIHNLVFNQPSSTLAYSHCMYSDEAFQENPINYRKYSRNHRNSSLFDRVLDFPHVVDRRKFLQLIICLDCRHSPHPSLNCFTSSSLDRSV